MTKRKKDKPMTYNRDDFDTAVMECEACIDEMQF